MSAADTASTTALESALAWCDAKQLAYDGIAGRVSKTIAAKMYVRGDDLEAMAVAQVGLEVSWELRQYLEQDPERALKFALRNVYNWTPRQSTSVLAGLEDTARHAAWLRAVQILGGGA